ncbi:MAG TPA: hypothetical protein VEG39_01790 [Clostridia bacterium]|nr:hypothetical protein [Clostridia bacterium]
MAKNMQTNILLGGKVLPSLNNAFAMANKRMLQVNKTAGIFSRATGTMRNVFSTASRFIGLDSLLMGAGFAYVGQKGLMLASDLKEVQNVVDVTFGGSARVIDAWSKTTSNDFGIAELQAKRYTGTLGAMFKSSGLGSDMILEMSKNLTGLTGDFSSFYNIAQSDMFEKIQAGMAGEIKPLRDLGINMSVANLEAFALSKGIKTAWDKMGQANQVAIRYAYLMQVSKDAQGDFKRTQGEFANQLRLVQNNFNKIISTVAGKFLPTANKAVTWANRFMTNLDVDKLGQSFSDFGGEVADVFNTYIKPALNWAITTGWPRFKDGLNDIYTAARWFTDLAIDNWPLIEPVLWGITSAMIGAKVATWGLFAASEASLIINALTKAWGAATFALEWMRAGLSLATLAQWALNAAWVANPIGVIIAAVTALGIAIYALYKNWDKITSFFIDSWNKVKAVFGGKIEAPEPRGSQTQYDNPRSSYSHISTNPRVKGYASGGFSDRAAIFGEAGMEAAIPIKPGNRRSIWLLAKTAEMLGLNIFPQVRAFADGGFTEQPSIGNRPVKHVLGGSGPNITYAPVNHIYFDGNGDVKEQVKQGMEAAYPQFENMVDEFFGGRRRLSFG